MTLEDLKQHKAMVEAAQADYDAAKAKYAKEHCPFKVGDRRKITGFSYEGFDMIVERAGIKESWHWKNGTGYEWVLRGAVLKKDGTPSKRDVADTIPVKGDK